jgi:hypothetical protein
MDQSAAMWEEGSSVAHHVSLKPSKVRHQDISAFTTFINHVSHINYTHVYQLTQTPNHPSPTNDKLYIEMW